MLSQIKWKNKLTACLRYDEEEEKYDNDNRKQNEAKRTKIVITINFRNDCVPK